MISAVALEHTDQIHSLLIGADDYMTKPLPLPVFKARIQALLRRSTNWQDGRQVYVDAHLKIDLYRKEVFIQGRQVFLSDLEYRLLELLVVNRNQTVPMAEIIEQLWFSEVSKNHAYHVRSYIMRLRRLIEPDMNASRYLINEHGLGYRFDSQPFHTVSQSYINHI